MGLLEEKLRGKSLADYTNTQLRLALGAVLYTNTADMWKRYLNQIGYTGDVSQMLQKYYVDNNVPSQFRNYINAGASIFNPQHLFLSGEQGYAYDLNDNFAEKTAYRRNLLTWSEQFNNAAWNKASATVTANSAVAPDGTTTADTITATAASGYVFPATNIFASAGGNTYTYSVYAKAGTSNVVTLLCTAASTYNATFNLATQVVSSVSANAQASMVSVGSGWFRLILTCNSVADRVYTELQNGRIANGTTIFLWGAQLEVGSTATEYQRVTDWNTELLAAFPQTALYLDSAGTTPASVNGLVGLVLDKSQAGPTARRNLLTYSEQLDNAAWTKAGVSITPNNTTAPDGAVTADFVYVSATGTFREVYALSSMTSGVTYTQTYYAKAAGINYCQILFPGAFGGNDIANFDLTDGTVGTVVSTTTGLSAQIQSVGSGWYRISATFAGVATGSYRASLCLIPSKTAVRGESMTADALNGIHVWGAQLEARASATDYQRVVQSEGGWLVGNHAYQSTTGNKPVLRGTPVGGNLVTNGDFASGTGWTAGSGWAIGSGVATATTSSGTLTSTLTATIAKVYRLTYTITRSAGSIQPSFGGVSGASRTAAGTYVEYLTASSTAALVFTGTTFSGTVDNVEVVDVSAGQVQAPYALQFDGVDDFLRTASVDFTATDKMTVCHGVRKFSDATQGIVVELTASLAANNGSFYLAAPNSAGANYAFASKGTISATDVETGFTAPHLAVITGIGNIAGDSALLRTNGVAGTAVTTDQGTGNYSNAVFYFGRRGGTTLPYNGLMFSSVCVGKTVSAIELANIERWVNTRTGAY